MRSIAMPTGSFDWVSDTQIDPDVCVLATTDFLEYSNATLRKVPVTVEEHNATSLSTVCLDVFQFGDVLQSILKMHAVLLWRESLRECLELKYDPRHDCGPEN
jgi:hypothetical protein